MLSDEALETFARHLSLPEVGMPGQEKLSQTHVVCMDHDAWAQTFRQALARAGVTVNDTAEGIAVTHDAHLPKNTARFSEHAVHIGPIDYSHAADADAVGPLQAKQVWLGAALAAEMLLWILGHRPVSYWLQLDFPRLAVVLKR